MIHVSLSRAFISAGARLALAVWGEQHNGVRMASAKRLTHNNAAGLRPSLSDCFLWWGKKKKKGRKTKVKEYKEVGRSGTEAGGADQTFHPPTEVKDRQEPHCFHHIRNPKEPQSRRIKSHWKSEALLWLSTAQGHTRCTTGTFCAYLCGHARPPVTTEHTHISWLHWHHKQVYIADSTPVWTLPGKGAWMTLGGTRWSGEGWIRTPGEFDAAAQFWVSATRTPLPVGSASPGSRPSSSNLGIHSEKESSGRGSGMSLLPPSLAGELGAEPKLEGSDSLEAMHALSYALSTCGPCQQIMAKGQIHCYSPLDHTDL